MLIREHESNGARCIHCGVKMPTEATCILHEDGNAPPPRRRISALDDIENIRQRMSEIAREEDPVKAKLEVKSVDVITCGFCGDQFCHGAWTGGKCNGLCCSG